MLDVVSVPEFSEWGSLTGTVTAAAEGEVPMLGPPAFIPAFFVVNSGPCTVAEGGRCVGRWPGGYRPSEDCAISVARAVGPLGACPVFDTEIGGGDILTLPCGRPLGRPLGCPVGAGCPIGAVLAGGQTLAWHSNDQDQGANGGGLPYSSYGAGGGWQICF